MPSPRHLTRRRFCLPGLLLVAAALTGWAAPRSWGTVSQERAMYERIQAGMEKSEVDSYLQQEWRVLRGEGGNWGVSEEWVAPNGARLTVDFDMTLHLTTKTFEEGDMSLRGRVARLVERVRRW
jgi:hypothetical protein